MEEELILDLVALATAANNVIIKGSFPGSMADEVTLVLDKCNAIYDRYVVPSDDSSDADGGSDSTGTD